MQGVGSNILYDIPLQLRVVLSPHLTLLDTVTWHHGSLSPEAYAARVASDLALPWRCAQHIAHALHDALVTTEDPPKIDPSFPKVCTCSRTVL